MSANVAMLFTKSCAIKFNTFSRLVRYTSTFRTSTMEGVYVRCIPSDEKMQITLNYKRPGGNIKTFNMDRFRVEEVHIIIVTYNISRHAVFCAGWWLFFSSAIQAYLMV